MGRGHGIETKTGEADMKTNQRIAVHSIWPFMLLLGAGGFGLTGWLPPPAPSLGADRIAAMLNPDNIPLRIGVSLLAVGSPVFILFCSTIAHQMRRMEGTRPVYAGTMLACTAIASAMVLLPAYLWLAVSYRADLPPVVIQVGSDLAFFLLIAAFPPLVMALLLIAITILSAPEDRRVYPRWVGYANIWVAIAQLPGLVTPFVKTGPFTYAGLFGFWLIVSCFGFWSIIMWWQTLQAINREEG
jgi:hypothetical protein